MFLFSLIELCFPSGAQKECAEGLFLYSEHVLNTNITSDSSKKKLKKKVVSNCLLCKSFIDAICMLCIF